MKFEAVQDAARSAGAFVLRPLDRLSAQLCDGKIRFHFDAPGKPQQFLISVIPPLDLD